MKKEYVLTQIQKHRLTIGVAIIFVIGFVSGMQYKTYAFKHAIIDAFQETVDGYSNQTNETEAIEVKEEYTCPEILSLPSSFEFQWNENTSGEKQLYLFADFVKEIAFADNWELNNFPENSWLQHDSFVCNPGSEAGESVHKLYCDTTWEYKPELIKRFIDADGEITYTEKDYISSFVFDAAGKDVDSLSGLNSLNLESISCKDTY